MLRSLCISLFAWSVLGAGSALAAQAVTSADMTLRQGPGDHYKHLATIVAGSQVDLRECDEANWCHVIYRKLDGWVHVNRVETSAAASRVDSPAGSAGTGAYRERAAKSGADDGDASFSRSGGSVRLKGGVSYPEPDGGAEIASTSAKAGSSDSSSSNSSSDSSSSSTSRSEPSSDTGSGRGRAANGG